MKELNKLKNYLLSGKETNPQRTQAISRSDILPGLEVYSERLVEQTSGIPRIQKDSDLPKAFMQPENFTWTPGGSVCRIQILRHTFTSAPYQIEGEWFVKTRFGDSDKETDVSLWDLGVIPDYVKRPKGDSWYPAGWNPCCTTIFWNNQKINKATR